MEIVEASKDHLELAFEQFCIERPETEPPGAVGSRIRVAWEYYQRVKKVYINGSHSTVGALSWNDYVEDRNNQGTKTSSNIQKYLD